MAEPPTVRNAAGPTGPRTDSAGHGNLPGQPDPGRGSWRAASRRTMAEFKNDFLQDRAAALTYYGVQAIFPGILVLVSLLGLVGQSATQSLITNLTNAAPGTVRTILVNAVRRLEHGHSAAGVLAIVGLVLALWSTSSYVAAFMRAANAIYDVPEGRPAWKTLPLRVGVTLLLMVLLVASAVIVVLTGGLARHVGQVLGIGSAAVTTWSIAKWPVLLILVCLMVGVLYWASPNARQGFRSIVPGAVVAVVIWLIASGLFALYVANFGHYDKVYGTIAGMIIFLIWLWISNIAILLGAEFNAELERGRAITAGNPPDAEPFVEMRDTTKLRRSRRAGKAAT
ncbi:MAG TPA: YihY/virulence factor BrkB family protein [Streptosporangiaceae bacterium]|nr:YihY/virulence factor BrkB family protein [Streptosporangiaceae bacterium]